MTLSNRMKEVANRYGNMAAALLVSLGCAYPSAEALAATQNVVVSAKADVADGIGAMMTVYVNGVAAGTTEVKAASYTDYTFTINAVPANPQIDVVYTNDTYGSGGVDRNLYVQSISFNGKTLQATTPGVVYDRGAGDAAFDGVDIMAGQSELWWNGALRFDLAKIQNPYYQYSNAQANGQTISPVPANGIPGNIDHLYIQGYDVTRFTLNASDALAAGSHRSELAMTYQPFNEKRSYKFKYMIPPEWISEVNGTESLFQMHGADGLDAGEVARSPCFALLIKNDQVFIAVRYDTNPISTTNPPATLVGNWYIEKGKWVDVELVAKWAYDSTGETQVYKDGQLVYSGVGPNCYNDPKGPYPKIGIYHWEPFPSYITSQTLYTTNLVVTKKQ